MSNTLSWAEATSLFTLFIACAGVIANTFQGDGEPLIASLAFSGIAFTAAYSLVRWLGDTFLKAGLKGNDMSKRTKVEIPEAMGAVAAVVYLLTVIVFIPFPFYKELVAETSGGGNRDVMLALHDVENGRVLHRFPHSKLASYLSALLSLHSIIILGLTDDLFDIRWRHKFFLPALASIPMLIVYHVDYGVTTVIVPHFLSPYLHSLAPYLRLLGLSSNSSNMLDLGYLYYLYMASTCIFSSNCINILAGINGIEVAQSIVIALLLLANDIISLYIIHRPDINTTSEPYHPATDPHRFSIYLLLPFIGVSLGLLPHNWFPARVFVGDTYCYFAGMVFAIVSILGHFSKTLLLLLIPQIFNFIYSAPQLFHIVPCPRHRLPRFNARTGLLEPSMAEWRQPPRKPIAMGLELLEKGVLPGFPPLINLERDDKGQIVKSSNLTILNLFLIWFGPMREDRLAIRILIVQILCGVMGLLIRHQFARVVFGMDNRV